MTEKELIAIVDANQTKVNKLTAEISNLETNTDYLVKEYISEHSKYKVGEVVNYIVEKYKTPRKYIIQKVWGFVEKQNDGTMRVRIFYNIKTANGFTPNRGWSIDESELKLAK